MVAYLQWWIFHPLPFPSLCKSFPSLLGKGLFLGIWTRQTLWGSSFWGFSKHCIFQFPMGNFPGAGRKPRTVWQMWQEVPIHVHIVDAFPWQSNLCGVLFFSCYSFCWQSKWGHLERIGGIGVWQSSRWISAICYLIQALNVLLYVPNPHLPCRVLGGFNWAMYAWSLARGRGSMDASNYHYYWNNLYTSE